MISLNISGVCRWCRNMDLDMEKETLLSGADKYTHYAVKCIHSEVCKWLIEEEEKKKYKCPHCGGPLSEVRVQNGKQLRHCFSCHFEYYKGGAG